MRKREWVWMFITALLFCAHAGIGNSEPHQVVPEAKAVAERKKAELYAAVLAACLNGKNITDGHRVVRCKVAK